MPSSRSPTAARRHAITIAAFCVALSLLGGCGRPAVPSAAGTASPPPPLPMAEVAHADFRGLPVPQDVRTVADWVVASGDHGGRPFAVIDKRGAHLHVFDRAGRLEESSWVLVGEAIGDDTVPGIGDKAIADIRPEERTTPAGRFVTMPGRNADGHPVVWIDYDAAVSMHEVIAGQPSEHRLERLASADPARHRVSWGCINVPRAFFRDIVQPAFATKGGLVYVLPDKRPLADVFPGVARRG